MTGWSQWVLHEWTEITELERQINLEEFRDRLKQLILKANRSLDDAYQKLKLDLDKLKCDWKCDAHIRDSLKMLIEDPDDVPHVALAASRLNASYLSGKPCRAFYVTSDAGVLRARDRVEKDYSLTITRPGFAYAYYKMWNRGNS